MAKTYDTYKDSGIAWIGEIPGDWRVGLVGKYFKEINNPNINQEETNTLQFKMGEIISKSKGDSKYSPETIEAYNVVEPGTIMINGLNLSFDLISQRVAQVRERGAITSTYLAIWPTNGMKSDYAKYLLKAYDNNKALHAMGRGLRATLSYRTFRSEPILIPTAEEQQSISSFLDTKCGEIDSLISIQEEMISELLAYKQSVITEAVTKGLDKKAKMKNSGVEWIGDIPEEWEVIKIQYLNQGLTDGTHGTYNRVDNGRLLLSSKNVREKDLLITDSESQISEEDYQSIISNGFPKKGDLLMCCIGASIGRCIIYKYDETYAFQRSVIFIRCNKLIKPELLRYNLLSNNSLLQELFLINQSAQAGLYQGQVKEIKVIVPPISKQKQIIDYLDEKTSQIDSLIALKQSKIESLKEYKKSIIYEYVTGKKRV